jgi:hypothetical protein
MTSKIGRRKRRRVKATGWKTDSYYSGKKARGKRRKIRKYRRQTERTRTKLWGHK